MSREVMQKALEALENISNWLPTIGQKGLRDYEAGAITDLREALAQPEQEPVAIADGTFNHNCPIGSLLYTSPPHRQSLTNEEIAEVAERMEATDAASSFWREFARDIEAKLKEKNA